MINQAAAGLSFMVACVAISAAQARPPNVVYVMADEWRAQAFGYAGDPNAHTPAIDRFAAQSINVRNMVSGCPVCCPARASMETGQYPLRDGVFLNDVPLRPTGTTLGEAFRQAGYATAYIGKWHLYGSPAGRGERRRDFIPPPYRFGFEYWKAAECCHDYNHSFYYAGDDREMRYWPGYDAESETKDACDYIAARARSAKPFMLVLSWGPPHNPFGTAPEKYRAMYRTGKPVLRPNVPDSARADASAELRGYYAHIAALDDCFAQLLTALKAARIADNTIVVFTSDHGDMMGSQGLYFKLMPWDESTRVPMLIRYPSKFGRRGRTSDVLMNTPDIMPTLLGLCGIPVPAGVQGIDFAKADFRPQPYLPQSAYLSMPVPFSTALSYGIAAYRGVRTARYTYVRSIRGPWLLYDNVKDPYQMHNLCGDAAMAPVQSHLERELEAWQVKLGDKFLPGKHYVAAYGLGDYRELQIPTRRVSSPWGDWSSTLPPSVGPASRDTALVDLLDDSRTSPILSRMFPRLAGLARQHMMFGFLSLRLAMEMASKSVDEPALRAFDAAVAAPPAGQPPGSGGF